MKFFSIDPKNSRQSLYQIADMINIMMKDIKLLQEEIEELKKEKDK